MADFLDGTFNLKHRLIGAIVLITVAVILLPRVLTGTESRHDHAGSRQDRTLLKTDTFDFSTLDQAEPSQENNSKGTRIELLEEQPSRKLDGADDSTEDVAPRESETAVSEAYKANQNSVPEDSSTTESVVSGWVAQIGVFQSRGNAERLVDELAKDSINARLEPVVIEGRSVTRVLVGPFGTKSGAVSEGNKAMMRTHTQPVIKKWP